MKIELLDVVALTGHLPEYNLRRGQVGTVVEFLADGKAFEVEFSDRDGRTYESVGLRHGAGGQLLLPAIASVVREVKIEEGVMVVHLMDGMR